MNAALLVLVSFLTFRLLLLFFEPPLRASRSTSGLLQTLPPGILVSSARVLHTAGPGGAILAYLLTGTVAWSVIASLGEMTALMPVKAPIVEFASRYVDSAVGFATGWMYWLVLPIAPGCRAVRRESSWLAG